MQTIGESIRKARIGKGYSQGELSNKAGVSRSNLTKWELGITFPNIINLIPVADVLEITLDELVGRKTK